jgi:hypothetical protein
MGDTHSPHFILLIQLSIVFIFPTTMTAEFSPMSLPVYLPCFRGVSFSDYFVHIIWTSACKISFHQMHVMYRMGLGLSWDYIKINRKIWDYCYFYYFIILSMSFIYSFVMKTNNWMTTEMMTPNNHFPYHDIEMCGRW